MIRRRSGTFALTALLFLPQLWMVRKLWFVCDDALITFRFSRNWAMGFGPRYNLGEHVPVEGYSNFLWMAIAAVLERFHADVTVWMPMLSALCALALTAALVDTLVHRLEVDLPVAAVSGLALILFPPLAVWSSSGLATVPQALGMFLLWRVLVLEDDPRAPTVAGFVALLLGLVRTEGFAWAIVIIVLAGMSRLLAKKPVIRPLVTCLAIFLSIYGVYFAWRYSYYESLFANTAYAKVHMTADTLDRGGRYALMYFVTMVTPIPMMLGLAPALSPRWRAAAFPAAALAVGVPVYTVVVGGDYMAFFRMIVPGYAFQVVLLALLLQWLSERPAAAARPAALVLGLAVAVVGALPAWDVHLVPESVRRDLHVRYKLDFFRSELRQWEVMKQHTETWREKGEALAEYADPNDTFVAAAVGNVGYYSNLFIYDRNGLVNREVAMLPDEGPLRSPGHDKVVDRSFFFDQEPTLLDAKVVHGPRLSNRVQDAVREMEAFAVRDQYAPAIHMLEDGRRPRALVVLRRYDSDEVEAAWKRYRAELARMN